MDCSEQDEQQVFEELPTSYWRSIAKCQLSLASFWRANPMEANRKLNYNRKGFAGEFLVRGSCFFISNLLKHLPTDFRGYRLSTD